MTPDGPRPAIAPTFRHTQRLEVVPNWYSLFDHLRRSPKYACCDVSAKVRWQNLRSASKPTPSRRDHALGDSFREQRRKNRALAAQPTSKGSRQRAEWSSTLKTAHERHSVRESNVRWLALKLNIEVKVRGGAREALLPHRQRR